MTPPLPDANKKSPRVYRNLQTKDLENVTFSDVEATGDPLSIELHNEDELRRLVLVQLARLTVKSEWTGLLTGGGGGAMTSFNLNGDTGSAETVTNGDTVKIAGGTAIGTAVTSPDTVTITNTGVTSLTAGSNITLSGSTGAVTVSASSSSPTQQFSLEADSGATQTVPTDGTGTLSIDGGTGISTATGGANDQVVITNDGVTSLVAGSNITLSGSTGAVTVSASGGGGGSSAFTTPLCKAAFSSTYNKFMVSNYAPYALSGTNTTANYTLNTRPTAYPFISPVDGDIDKGFLVTTTAGSTGTKIVVGIYDVDGNNFPNSLIAELEFNGESAAVLTGAPTFTQTTELQAGNMYYFVVWFHGSGFGGILRSISNLACAGFVSEFSANTTNQPTSIRGANLTTGSSLPSTFNLTGGNPQVVNRPIFGFELA